MKVNTPCTVTVTIGDYEDIKYGSVSPWDHGVSSQG